MLIFNYNLKQKDMNDLIKSVIKILEEEKLNFHYSPMFVDNFIHDHDLLDMDAEFISNKIINWVNEVIGS